jgi:hypothetical protein
LEFKLIDQKELHGNFLKISVDLVKKICSENGIPLEKSRERVPATCLIPGPNLRPLERSLREICNIYLDGSLKYVVELHLNRVEVYEIG